MSAPLDNITTHPTLADRTAVIPARRSSQYQHTTPARTHDPRLLIVLQVVVCRDQKQFWTTQSFGNWSREGIIVKTAEPAAHRQFLA